MMIPLTDQLPPEILIVLCEQLAPISPKTLANLCLTSKTFHELGTPVLYRDVYLISRHGPLSGLTRFSKTFHAYKSFVSSIDVEFSKGHMSSFRLGIPSSHDFHEPVSVMLGLVPKLRTFTIYQPQHDQRNSSLPGDVITLLLKHLPEKVVNLEIDTGGVDKAQWGQNQPGDYCDSLSKILPRLEHLRLRSGYMCMRHFFSVLDAIREYDDKEIISEFPLKSLTVRLDMESEWQDSPENARSCRQRAVDFAPSDLALTLRNGLNKGLFPNLEHAIVISRFGNRQNFCTAKETHHSGFAIYDIIKNQTLLIPIMAVEAQIDKDVAQAASKVGDLFLLRTVEGTDRFASYHELSDALEPMTFRRLINTSPIPQSFFDFDQFRRKNQIELPLRIRMSLWDRETRTGQCLVTAREVEGLERPPGRIDEILPPGYRYIGQNKKGETMIS